MTSNSLSVENAASRRLSRSVVFALLLVGVIGLGVLMRTFHLFFVPLELPYHSGGLFAEFSHQIVLNGFRLPERIPYYSEAGIPYAYPPLPFYVLAALTETLPFSYIELINVLPPIVGAGGMLALYGLTRAFGLSRRVSLGSLAVFAVLPSAYTEVLYGEGLAESFGLLATIGFAATFRLFAAQRTLRSALITGVAGGLCVLASPGSAYGAAVSGLAFALFALSASDARERLRTVLFLGMLGLTAAAIAGPYLIPVTANHGPEIFTRALRHQYAESPLHILTDTLDTLLKFGVSKAGYYAWFWDALILASALLSLLKWGDWLLPAWLLGMLLIPREGVWLASVPASLMTGRFLVCEALPFLKRAIGSIWNEKSNILPKLGMLAGLVYFSLHGVFLLWAHPGWIHALSLETGQAEATADTVDALMWGQENLPPEARVVVIYSEHVEDWAPHLVRRTVVNMVFGTEWEPEQRREALALNEVLYACSDVQCAVDAVSATGNDPGSVYFFLSRPYLETWSQENDGAWRTVEIVFANRDAAFIQLLL